MIGRPSQFSVLWLLALLALTPLLMASDCQRFIWSFPTTDTPPIWSLDQSKILIHSDFGSLLRRMHVVDSDGSNVFSFPHNSGEYTTGVSPEGVIVFTSLDKSDRGLFGLSDPHYEIHTAMLDGSGRRRLTRGQDSHYAVWSPDGEAIAFSSSSGIYLMKKNGNGKKRIANRDMLQEHFPVAGLPFTAPVSWSPDGSKLAFLVGEDDELGAPPRAIYIASVDEPNFIRLPPTPNIVSFPAWSPDGNRIAFMNNDSGFRIRSAGDVSTIYTIDSNGGNLQEVASFADEIRLGDQLGKLSWSKDGSQIRRHRYPFVTVNVDGSRLRIMADCGFLAEWSPDESLIAVQYGDSLLTMKPDGSDIRLLAKVSRDGLGLAAGGVPSTNHYVLERCKWTEVSQ